MDDERARCAFYRRNPRYGAWAGMAPPYILSRIYSPDDGRDLGLVGMVRDAMEKASATDLLELSRSDSISGPVDADDHGSVSMLLTMAENSETEQFYNACSSFVCFNVTKLCKTC